MQHAHSDEFPAFNPPIVVTKSSGLRRNMCPSQGQVEENISFRRVIVYYHARAGIGDSKRWTPSIENHKNKENPNPKPARKQQQQRLHWDRPFT
mmetsp:Transcript_10205/g.20584  ORF Transcript_10205/g.20584 Transcript_10205/m.20584 type:complete len:94 (-) Transcript_10205:82-363(-)